MPTTSLPGREAKFGARCLYWPGKFWWTKSRRTGRILTAPGAGFSVGFGYVVADPEGAEGGRAEGDPRQARGRLLRRRRGHRRAPGAAREAERAAAARRPAHQGAGQDRLGGAAPQRDVHLGDAPVPHDRADVQPLRRRDAL